MNGRTRKDFSYATHLFGCKWVKKSPGPGSHDLCWRTVFADGVYERGVGVCIRSPSVCGPGRKLSLLARFGRNQRIALLIEERGQLHPSVHFPNECDLVPAGHFSIPFPSFECLLSAVVTDGEIRFRCPTWRHKSGALANIATVVSFSNDQTLHRAVPQFPDQWHK